MLLGDSLIALLSFAISIYVSSMRFSIQGSPFGHVKMIDVSRQNSIHDIASLASGGSHNGVCH